MGVRFGRGGDVEFLGDDVVFEGDDVVFVEFVEIC